MLAASKKGTVPVLVLPDGRVIDESLDIMRWALATCDPEDWLARDDPGLIATNDASFKQDLDAYKYPERHAGDRLMHRARGATFLAAINARLSKGGQLCGSERGFADAAIMPFVRQFAAVDQEWFDTLPLSDLRTWLKGHLGSDLFNATMMRIAPWSPGDHPAFFPPTKPPDVAQ